MDAPEQVPEQVQAIHTASNACARYQHEPYGGDVWQTPAELAESGVGDCEDFAIDALFRIRAAGLLGRVRLACCVLGGGVSSDLHMVCLHYPPESADPWVLDVAVDAVCRLTERPDLAVVYELGLDGVFLDGVRFKGRKVGSVEKMPPWADVLRRMAGSEGRGHGPLLQKRVVE